MHDALIDLESEQPGIRADAILSIWRSELNIPLALDRLRKEENSFVILVSCPMIVGHADDCLLLEFLCLKALHEHCVYALLMAMKYQKRLIPPAALKPLEASTSAHVRLALMDYYASQGVIPDCVDQQFQAIRASIRVHTLDASSPAPSPVFGDVKYALQVAYRVRSKLRKLRRRSP